MRKRAMIVAALSACVCGCGTLVNLVGEYRIGPPPMGLVHTPPEREVFGGVRLDAEEVWESLQDRDDVGPFYSTLGVVISTVDLPLSAVADTLTLPITVPATIDRDISRFYRINEFREQTANPEEASASTSLEQ